MFDKEVLKHIYLRLELMRRDRGKIRKLKLGRVHIIHGDFHEENMFFKNKRVRWVFDWEMVSTAPRSIEVARSLDFFCFYGHHETRNFNLAKIFLGGYNSVYPIDKEELANGIRGWYFHQLYDAWSLEGYYLKNRKELAIFLEKKTKFLRYFSGHLEEFISKVTS